MIVKVSMSLLKKLLFEADADAAAAAPEPQQLSDDQKFRQQVDKLNAMPTDTPGASEVTAQDKKFTKMSGDWYISTVQLSPDDLLALVNDDSKASIKAALDKKPDSITIKGDQFIDGGTQNAANFINLGTGLWSDRSPVPVEMVAQYIALPDTSASFQANVAGPGGAKPLVYKQDELMIVIDNNDMFVMSSRGNQNDPLGATAVFLNKTDMLTNFKNVGAARKGFLGTGGAVVEDAQKKRSLETLNKLLKTDGDFIDVPMSKLNLGDLTKAIGKSRTLAGKIGDIFSGANVKMNFTFTQYGPALKRSLVVGGRKGEGGSGALSSADVEEIMKTQLFREEDLPRAGQGDYVVAIKDLITTEDKKTDGSLTVSERGVVNCTPALTFISELGGRSVKTFADAFFIYSDDYKLATLKAAAAAPAAPAEAPTVQTGTSPNTPADGEAVGGPDSGAAFFEFKKSDIFMDVDDNKSAEYIKIVTNELKSAGKVTVTVIGTADVKGENPYNLTLSTTRAQFLVNKIKNDLSNITFKALGVGEVPYAKDQDANEQTRVYQRYAKVYYGDLDQSNATSLAVEFTKKIAPGEVTEAAALQEIRLQIRKLLRSR